MRNLWKRISVIALTAGGLVTLSATAAHAGIASANHCEP